MVNGTPSKQVRIKQGLPQGSVLSPLLFLLFINDLVNEMPHGVDITLFADDVAIYCSHRSLEEAQKLLQKPVSAVEIWSNKNKLDLNLSKCCSFFFSSAPGDAKWRPNMVLKGERMNFGEGPQQKNPQFLG